jgi:hypothetical protein
MFARRQQRLPLQLLGAARRTAGSARHAAAAASPQARQQLLLRQTPQGLLLLLLRRLCCWLLLGWVLLPVCPAGARRQLLEVLLGWRLPAALLLAGRTAAARLRLHILMCLLLLLLLGLGLVWLLRWARRVVHGGLLREHIVPHAPAGLIIPALCFCWVWLAPIAYGVHVP